jgi:hypothetical protein
MRQPIVGIFETETSAREALDKLRAAGFGEARTLLVTPAAGKKAGAFGALASALAAGQLLGEQAGFYAERVREGRSLVLVQAPVGQGKLATEILQSCGPVDADLVASSIQAQWGRGAPLSAALNMPVLLRGRPSPLSDYLGLSTSARRPRTLSGLMRELISPHFSLSERLGLGLLSHNAAPLSSWLRLRVLAAPKRPWTHSLGLPLLIDEAAPLSARAGMKTLTHDPAPLSSRLGMSVLLNNPAPLSSAIGLPTATGRA